MKNRKINKLVKPVLKWVGGKRQLISSIDKFIPDNCSTYVEPFIGGGAVLFNYQPQKAIINDYNQELINVYRIIKQEPEKLIISLENHEKNNNEDYFYKIRALDRTEEYKELDKIEKASRIIFLNKTCFNGLYRVNMSGEFNSPYGKYKNPNIVDRTSINAVSNYLNKNNVKINCGDYKESLKGLRKGSFVYFDPPYMPISSSSSFTGYTDGGFSYQCQVDLKNECDKLRDKKIPFLQSNSDCKEIRELYSEYEIHTVKAKRSINSNSEKRGEINEVLIYYGGK